MSRAAGLFNKDFNHLCFRSRISMSNIRNIDCLLAVRKEKEVAIEQEIIESLTENEQAEREHRKHRFNTTQPEPVSAGSTGINTAPSKPTGGSDVVFVEQGAKSKLANRFNKPIDTNTER